MNMESILDKDKLNHSDFLDWHRNLRIVLKQKKKDCVLENQTPDEPPALLKAAHDAWLKHIDDSLDVSCLMLASMVLDLQRDLEHYTAFDMIEHLKEMFGKQARIERYDIMRALHSMKMEENGNVSTHVLKMKSYMDQLERLGSPYPQDLAADIILNSLPKSYNAFIMNYNMNGWEKHISKLYGMLKTAGKNIPSKTPQVLVIREGKVKKNKGKNFKGKPQASKGKGKKAPQNSPPNKKEKVAKYDTCFKCGVVRHWKRNCFKYLAELKNKKVGEGPSDTGCGTHICNSLQGFRKSKELKAYEMVLHVGNGARVAVQALGHFDLCLRSGMYLTLDNVCLITSITRNIISVSCLRKSGYDFKFVDDNIHSFLKGRFYFEARPINGIELNLDETSNNKFLYHAQTRFESNISLALSPWSYKQNAHISIPKEWTFGGNDIDSFDICESCLCGKMRKSFFFGTSERAIVLLGIIHTDVCGPFKTMSRYGERYYITFTDDFSRFGYVYLMKHKHEAFEKFKLFQSEVENQLDKTIKILRSDRGGEYLSQEFQDHLRSRGIISQLTPLRTPYLNGVFERRNRTLLDMSYALHTAACILNVAPTKKVEKTPYEMWYGRPPSLSYMKVWGCEAYVRQEISNKLEPRFTKCIFVGYPRDCLGYYFYIPNENKIFISRKVEFFESKFLTDEASGRHVELEEDQEPQPDASLVGTSIEQEVVKDEEIIVL
uniref:Integrase catalytic domain-containing protein n=1 Tax=Lactuca sativa TaxID=4236 RepID=A0A9R1XDN2_LACSA|nr:hypothetical protein LSAT_V11C400177410 [Lactuca sativa]